MRRLVIGLSVWLAIFAIGLLLSTPAARAGGDPGGPPPVGLSLDSFALTADGAVVFDGTLTCAEAMDVTITMVVQQGPERHFLSVHRAAEFACRAQTPTPVRLVFAPAFPGRYHPGAITVGIELAGCTLPDDEGNQTCHNLWGIVEREVGPAGR